jgi:hypothetical protein
MRSISLAADLLAIAEVRLVGLSFARARHVCSPEKEAPFAQNILSDLIHDIS